MAVSQETRELGELWRSSPSSLVWYEKTEGQEFSSHELVPMLSRH